MTRIGLIGTGLMGQPMVQRLLAVEYPVIAYNRTPSKLEPLQEAGAAIARSPAELLQTAECVILMLTDAEAIRQVLFSPQSRQALSGRTLIQMGTIAPTESQAIAQEVAALGGDYLEAPVLGSIPEARTGKLLVMVGATPSQFQQWLNLLQNFGPDPCLIGPVGAAAATKLALNQLIAALSAAFSLSLGVAQHYEVDVETLMKILRQSALYAPTFDKKLPRMLNRDYANPNFPTKHLLKDTDLFIATAAAAGLNISSIAGVRQVLERACQINFAEADYSALFSAINPTGNNKLEGYPG